MVERWQDSKGWKLVFRVDFHQEISSAKAEEARRGKKEKRKGLMEKNKTWRESSLLMEERQDRERDEAGQDVTNADGKEQMQDQCQTSWKRFGQ